MPLEDVTTLIVEDEVGLAELFEIWLSGHCEVETVTSGPEAVELLGDHLDVVVLDWRMPELSGADILDRIRERGLDCRVAVVTGLDPEIADIADVDAVLRKPVGEEELVETLEQLAG